MPLMHKQPLEQPFSGDGSVQRSWGQLQQKYFMHAPTNANEFQGMYTNRG